jgi:putative salt-induced outer membrane protein YdiY
MNPRSVLLVLVVAGAASADDVVVLRNGDRLSGKVDSLAGGKLKIVTAHSGAVLVSWSEIASVTTEAAVKVKLDTGEIVEGRLSTGEGGKLKIETPSAAAPVEVDPAKVAKINEDTDWHGFIDLGFRATGGNSRTQGAYVGTQLLRETDRDRFLIGANFNYGRAAGVTTARNAYGIVKYDYRFTPKFYGYVSEELLHDRFRDLRIRTVTSLGAGYIFVKSAPIDTWAEAGVAYVTNDFYDLEKDEGHLGGRIYHHLRVSLPLGLEFTNDLTFYPNFEHSKDWQIHDEAFISAGLGKGWTARAGVIWDYDHFIPKERRRHDVLYLLTIGYRF